VVVNHTVVMNHPFIPDYSKLSLDELNTKSAELIKRLNIAQRMTLDQYTIDQLWLILDSIDNEKSKRIPITQNEAGVVIETDPSEQEERVIKKYD
jgi:hypothetical protein